MSASTSLPIELWDYIVARITATTTNPHRFRDLAHLAWTCRDAYQAAHCPLFQHLRLLLRTGGESVPAVDLDADIQDKKCQQLMVDRHNQVVQSSVFPRYQHGQLTKTSERYNRIRSVSTARLDLFPFVVLDGKLYLASLAKNERSPTAPDTTGTESLWGTPVNVQVVGDLVLVPYPLHVVQELTIDDFGSKDEHMCSTDTLPDFLPFLYSLPTDQIHTYHLHTWSQNDPVGDHFTSIINQDYFLLGQNFCRDFGPSVKTISVYHNEYYHKDEKLYSTIGSLPCITHFEQFGASSYLWVGDGAQTLFQRASLVSLVLDYDIDDYAPIPEPFAFHLPSLKSFTLTMDIADIVFDEDLAQVMFPAAPTASDNAFPVLTHLTLFDVEAAHPQRRPTGSQRFLPWIPFHHMPKLTHLHIPFSHRGIENIHVTEPSFLHALFSHTRTESLHAPGLCDIATDGDHSAGPDPHYATNPVIAHHLTHINTRFQPASQLASYAMTPALVSLTLDTGEWLKEHPLFDQSPQLTDVTLHTAEFHEEWWHILMRQVPHLRRLAIINTEDEEETGVFYSAGLAKSAKYQAANGSDEIVLRFPHLESFSFTSNHATYEFSDLDMPNLKHLAIHTEHPKSHAPVFERLDRLELAGPQCARMVQRVLESVPAHCTFKFVPREHMPRRFKLCSTSRLRLRFAGDANRHVWRALLRGNSLRDGLVAEGVVVAVDRAAVGAVSERDAGLIARVIEHLLVEQSHTLGFWVKWTDDGDDDAARLQNIVDAVRQRKVACFSYSETVLLE